MEYASKKISTKVKGQSKDRSDEAVTLSTSVLYHTVLLIVFSTLSQTLDLEICWQLSYEEKSPV